MSTFIIYDSKSFSIVTKRKKKQTDEKMELNCLCLFMYSLANASDFVRVDTKHWVIIFARFSNIIQYGFTSIDGSLILNSLKHALIITLSNIM